MVGFPHHPLAPTTRPPRYRHSSTFPHRCCKPDDTPPEFAPTKHQPHSDFTLRCKPLVHMVHMVAPWLQPVLPTRCKQPHTPITNLFVVARCAALRPSPSHVPRLHRYHGFSPICRSHRTLAQSMEAQSDLTMPPLVSAGPAAAQNCQHACTCIVTGYHSLDRELQRTMHFSLAGRGIEVSQQQDANNAATMQETSPFCVLKHISFSCHVSSPPLLSSTGVAV
jgi:hypothetical protein